MGKDRVMLTLKGPEIHLIEAHPTIVRSVRSLIRKAMSKAMGLKPGDAIHRATAGWLNVDAVEFHTTDDRMLAAGDLVPFRICKPSALQFPFPQ